jgi:hypothetical protein
VKETELVFAISERLEHQKRERAGLTDCCCSAKSTLTQPPARSGPGSMASCQGRTLKTCSTTLKRGSSC